MYYQRRALKQSTWKEWHVSPLSSATEITNLRKFTKYNIRVAGFTSKGVGVQSPIIVAVTAEDGRYYHLTKMADLFLILSSMKFRFCCTYCLL